MTKAVDVADPQTLGVRDDPELEHRDASPEHLEQHRHDQPRSFPDRQLGHL